MMSREGAGGWAVRRGARLGEVGKQGGGTGLTMVWEGGSACLFVPTGLPASCLNACMCQPCLRACLPAV